jgi:hypothetical protein
MPSKMDEPLDCVDGESAYANGEPEADGFCRRRLISL